jgi:hypothetical protein
MAGKINPFGKTVSERSALDILQENFGIGIRDYDRGADTWDADGQRWVWQENVSQECVIEFSVNEGKGTGRQAIPVNEFRQYVAALQQIIDSDYQEPEGADRTTYVPTNIVASQSFKMVPPRDDKNGERNVVSIRCTGGKGAKPMMVSRDEFPEVVSILRGIADKVEDYEKQAWANYHSAVSKEG